MNRVKKERRNMIINTYTDTKKRSIKILKMNFAVIRLFKNIYILFHTIVALFKMCFDNK